MIANELWTASGHAGSLDDERWPTPEAAALVSERIEMPVQVNGRLRGRITVPAGAREEEVVAAALADPQIQGHVAGRALKKRVVVPGRMVNLVV